MVHDRTDSVLASASVEPSSGRQLMREGLSVARSDSHLVGERNRIGLSKRGADPVGGCGQIVGRAAEPLRDGVKESFRSALVDPNSIGHKRHRTSSLE